MQHMCTTINYPHRNATGLFDSPGVPLTLLAITQNFCSLEYLAIVLQHRPKRWIVWHLSKPAIIPLKQVLQLTEVMRFKDAIQNFLKAEETLKGWGKVRKKVG